MLRFPLCKTNSFAAWILNGWRYAVWYWVIPATELLAMEQVCLEHDLLCAVVIRVLMTCLRMVY
ncbi:hypothetical protein M413DRAFT_449841 [Hebeloma cylindrosporum]|uniref:Uncharacterized protein n=1 Tax=Hebeloma cylindrosporum TaxID=76867 RepID=A0A0C3BV37_HEBCY|nr:hypothetical protein M413DRAFT_449841 [Hebeloma cylindrosporum h7]